MTAKEAFALALDEIGYAIAEDNSAKRNRILERNVASAKQNAAKLGGNVSGAIGISKSIQERLANHECTATKRKCPLIGEMEKEFEKQGVDSKEAAQLARTYHSNAGKNGGMASPGQNVQPNTQEAKQPNEQANGGENQENQQSSQPTQPPKVDPQTAEQITQEVVEDPEKIESVPEGQLLEKSETIDTEAGEIKVDTIAQKASVAGLIKQAKNGNQKAIDLLEKLSEHKYGKNYVSPKYESPQTDHGSEENKSNEESKQQKKPSRDPNLPDWQDDDNGMNPDGSRKETKVGNKTYVDISNMPFWAGMAAAFKAGYEGKDIVTDWMKVTGKWDKIKGSDNRNSVRNAIMSNRLMSEIEGHLANKETLSAVAEAELENIKDALENAKTPTQRKTALSMYKKWLEEYGKGTSNGNASTNQKVSQAMDNIHKDDGCAMSNTVVDENGSVSNDGAGSKLPLPGSDILGDPKSTNKASIDNLEEKKKKLIDFINGKGVNTSDVSTETSFNNTFVKMKVDSASDAKKIEKMVEDLIGEVGGDVGYVYDPKTRTVVLSIENTVKGDVSAKEVFESEEWKQAKSKMACPIVIGKDMKGKPVIADMKDLVHLLVGGETGNGKSVAMNTILTSIMMGTNPKDVKMVLIDPKGGAEFGAYGKAKHNLLPVAKDSKSAIERLTWIRQEMENRAKLFDKLNQENGTNFKNIDDYNNWAEANGKEKMPRIVVAIDELTELQKQGGKELNDVLGTLGNKARFTGIHLIAATQNPTKANIGDVKDNFPARLGFGTTSRTQSQNILGHSSKYDPETGENLIGTEALKRKGEFVFEHGGKSYHGQGAMLGDEDVNRVIDYWDGKTPAPSPEKPTPSSETATNGSPTNEPAAHSPTQNATAESSTQPNESATPSQPAASAEANGNTQGTSTSQPTKPQSEQRDWNNKDDRKAMVDDILKTELDKIKKDKTLSESERYDAQQEAYEDHARRLKKIENEFAEKETNQPKAESQSQTEQTSSSSGDSTQEEDTFNSPEERLKRAREYLKKTRDRLTKDFHNGRISESDYHKQLGKADEWFNQRKQDIKDGLSDADIDARTQKQEQEREQKNKQLRDSVVRETHGRPKYLATEGKTRSNMKNWKPMPKEKQDAAKKVLPEGWRLDGGGKPMVDSYGNVGARNPENGSYGYIAPDGSLKVLVDTTHPEYKGERSPEAIQAKKERDEHPDDKEREKQYNRIAFGHDEGLTSRAYLLSAIASFLVD